MGSSAVAGSTTSKGCRTPGGKGSRRLSASLRTSCCSATLRASAWCFLPRHGRGHKLPPDGVNYRANIDALKRSGVTDILSLSAVGSLREELSPGTFVLVDQFIDRTIQRDKSFFGPALVAHVSMAHPSLRAACRCSGGGGRICGCDGGSGRHLPGHGRAAILEPSRIRIVPDLGLRCDRHDKHARGQARQGGGDLLRYRCYGHRLRLLAPGPRPCPGGDIICVLTANADHARALVRAVALGLRDRPAICPAGCDHALDTAIITAPEARDPAMAAKLDAVAGPGLEHVTRGAPCR